MCWKAYQKKFLSAEHWDKEAWHKTRDTHVLLHLIKWSGHILRSMDVYNSGREVQDSALISQLLGRKIGKWFFLGDSRTQVSIL